MPFSQETLQKAFELAFYLHPHRGTALDVVITALCEVRPSIKVPARTSEYLLPSTRTAGNPGAYKLMLSEEGWDQESVFKVSEHTERGQEKHRNRQEAPGYHPTSSDWSIRFIEALVRATMRGGVHYVALGLGCYLYQYRFQEMRDLFTLFFPNNPRNDERLHEPIRNPITKRFPDLKDDTLEQKIRMRPARKHELTLVPEALSYFTPWGTDHVEYHPEILDDRYVISGGREGNAGNAEQEQWARVHALIDPTCLGLKLLIQMQSHMSLDNPDDKLGMPFFPHDEDGQGNPPQDSHGGRRTNPDPLTETEMYLIRKRYSYFQERRQRYRQGRIQVREDGEERIEFNPGEDASPSLYVSASASYLEVYGLDEEGDCLLATVPVYHLQDGDDIRIRMAGGQRLGLRATIVREGTEDEPDARFHVRLAYRDAPFAWLASVLRSLGRRQEWETGMDQVLADGSVDRSLVYRGMGTPPPRPERIRRPGFARGLRAIYRRRLAPLCATGLILVLLSTSAWLGIEYFGQRGSVRGVAVAPLTNQFLLKFNENMPLRQVHALLRKIDARLVNGPLPTGFYLVESGLAVEKVREILNDEAWDSVLEGREFGQP